MLNEENQSEDLKAFEAELSSLHPHADGLDRRWRFLLAQEAALNENLASRRLCLSITPTDPPPVPPECQAETDVMLKHNLRNCDILAASQLVCIRCGGPILPACHDKHRWAWPAAFSAMTTVAAVLLAALVVRIEPTMSAQIDQQAVSSPAMPQADEQAAPDAWLAYDNGSRRRFVSNNTKASYLDLRDQVLREGIDSWESPVSSVVKTTNATERPLSCREPLDYLLRQENIRGS